MKRQYLYLGAGVTLLAALNLWQWLPGTKVSQSTATVRSSGSFQPEDFRLKMSISSTTERTVRGRNLFRSNVPPPPPPAVKIVEPPPAPPPKTPEQLAEEAARAELAQIKLVGVVFRGGKGQAFLVKGENVFLAQTGDKVGERFVVESIGTDNVRLKDASTNVSGEIPVSGK